ncbi:MAG: hypothetical protein NZ741_12465, partial [Armatimonadetes bacterium]|nr:hypothetical protein [Armatimonadota bacterium]
YYDTPGEARNVFVSGGDAYVADRDGGLLILRFATQARTFSVGGRIVLEDYNGDQTAQLITVELRQDGNLIRTRLVFLDPQGRYSLDNIAPGVYELAFKASHWLRRVVSVAVVSSDVTDVDVSLVNGDIDGDNEVSLADFGALVVAFGSMLGDEGWWNEDADLDGDGEVVFSDFDILLRNFGAVGDE